MTHELLAPELHALLGKPYNYYNGPSESDTEGINCEKLIHIAYRDRFGIVLPTMLRAAELYYDQNIFRSVAFNKEPLREGDIFCFGSPRMRSQEEFDATKLHVAYCIGEGELHEGLPILHATFVDGRVSIWPFGRFSTKRRYAELFRVKRNITI